MNKEFACPLCTSKEIKQYPISDFDGYRIVCPRCGEYSTTEEFLGDIEKDFLENNGYLLSGLARELYETGNKPLHLTYKDKEEILQHFLIPPTDDLMGRATKLLERIKKRTRYYGEGIKYSEDNDYPLAYAKNKAEFISICKLLAEAGYVDITAETGTDIVLVLTANGWKVVSNFEAKNQESEQGFVAIWFDEEGSMDESISTITQAVTEAGFKPMCIKGEHFSETIMDKALSEIRKSRFVIVDLTGSRLSVFFEAGFAFGLGVESIYVYKKDEDIKAPLDFYVKHYQCHSYKDVSELKDIVKDAIGARIN